MVFQNVVIDILLNEPTEEVQLTHRRHERRLTTRLKLNTFPSAEWVKEALGIRIQFTLVVEVHQEVAILAGERGVHLLGVIRDKVVDQAQTDRRFTL